MNSDENSTPYFGNASDDGFGNRGWFIGHFITGLTPLHREKDVEIKWAVHKKGEMREDWSESKKGSCLSMLISGTFRLDFQDRESIVLAKEGDYSLWDTRIAHRWVTVQDSRILTIRWL